MTIFSDMSLDRTRRDKVRERLDRFFDYIPLISLLNNSINAIQLRRFEGNPNVSDYQQYLRRKTIKRCGIYMIPFAKVIHHLWEKAKRRKIEEVIESNQGTNLPRIDSVELLNEPLSGSMSSQEDKMRQREWPVRDNSVEETLVPVFPLEPGQWELPSWYSHDEQNPEFTPSSKLSTSVEMPQMVTMQMELEKSRIEALEKSTQQLMENANKRWALMTQFHEVLTPLQTAMKSPETFYKNPQEPIVEAKNDYFKVLKKAVDAFEKNYAEALSLMSQLEFSMSPSLTLVEIQAIAATVQGLVDPVRKHFHGIEAVNTTLEIAYYPMMKSWQDNLQENVAALMARYRLCFSASMKDRAALKFKS